MCLTRECVRADARLRLRQQEPGISSTKTHTHAMRDVCACLPSGALAALLLWPRSARDPPLRSRTGEQSRICLHRLRRRGPQHAIRGQEMVIQMREADEESGGRQTDSLSQAGECEWQAREKS